MLDDMSFDEWDKIQRAAIAASVSAALQPTPSDVAARQQRDDDICSSEYDATWLRGVNLTQLEGGIAGMSVHCCVKPRL